MNDVTAQRWLHEGVNYTSAWNETCHEGTHTNINNPLRSIQSLLKK